MNLPNKLTMMRVVLVPVFMVFAALAKYGTADFNATFSLVAGIIFAVGEHHRFSGRLYCPEKPSGHRFWQVRGPAGRSVP